MYLEKKEAFREGIETSPGKQTEKPKNLVSEFRERGGECVSNKNGLLALREIINI
jgi:hypothetical protein